MSVDPCNHDGTTTRRFSGAITCDLCMSIVAFWKTAQPTITLDRKDSQ